MIRCRNVSIILLTCFSLSLPGAGLINPVYGAQQNIKEVQQNDPGKIYGKVTDIIDVAGYTYAEVDTAKGKVWAAGPPTPLKKGEMVSFTAEMPMQNFHSNSMGRDFPVIYFISHYVTNKESSTAVSAHPQIKQQQTGEAVKGINKVEGGYTISEIYIDKSSFKDKIIRVRGKVTKFSAGIMGKNWLHIRDSSTLDDLTVTTDGTVAVGDVIIAEGKLVLDKDYGYGYLYPVIMEDVTITKE